MSLQTQQKKLFAPQEGTLPVSVSRLSDAGFHSCIFGNKPCGNAVGMHPHRDPAAITVCCNEKGRAVTADDAFGCTRQI